jgi:FixJ family two-component response regulator
LTNGTKCDDLEMEKEVVVNTAYLYIVDDDDTWRSALAKWILNVARAQQETLEPFPKERILAFGTYQGALDDVKARASAAPADTLFCLVTDGSLDGSKNGLQMIQAFTEVLDLRLCHVILESGEERYRSGAEAVGAIFLHKPFDFEDLQEALAPFWRLLAGL